MARGVPVGKDHAALWAPMTVFLFLLRHGRSAELRCPFELQGAGKGRRRQSLMLAPRMLGTPSLSSHDTSGSLRDRRWDGVNPSLSAVHRRV